MATTGSDQDLLVVGRSIGFGPIIVEVKLARPPAWANRRDLLDLRAECPTSYRLAGRFCVIDQRLRLRQRRRDVVREKHGMTGL